MEKVMDLFDYMKEQTLENESPLASRMRPVSLDMEKIKEKYLN